MLFYRFNAVVVFLRFSFIQESGFWVAFSVKCKRRDLWWPTPGPLVPSLHYQS
jgi:hypothetical protein